MQLLHVFIVCAIIALLVAGAWSDLATRMIPHWIALGILPLALCLRARQGGDMLFDSVLVAFALFAGLTILHAKGLIGGGDVKLAAAIALALSPLQTLQFIEATALIGGILALVYLLAGRVPLRLHLDPSRRLLRRVMAIEMRRARKRGPLPYGIALAFAATLILLRT